MSARREILARIQTALGDHPICPPIPREYRGAQAGTGDVDLFVERVGDYQATLYRCPVTEVSERIADILAERGITPVLVPEGFPPYWLTGVEAARDTALTTAELDRIGGVLTTCAVAVAETGTIVLDHTDGQGRRALTLLPDYHLVVVTAAQIRATIPDGIARLDPARPLTWISGPSATSDIELNRVEGVHGPRTLDVLVVE